MQWRLFPLWASVVRGLDDGTNESSTKHLMFQVFFFFIISFKILCKKTFNLFYCSFSKNYKNQIKKFWVPSVCNKLWKKKILGTSDAWSVSLSYHWPSEPAYYIVDWRIFKSMFEIWLKILLCTTLWWELGGRSYQEVSATTVGALHINLAKDH